MAVTFAVGLRACCVAVGLLLVTARAAEPVSPLVGMTREQLLSRLGEPKSHIESGNRLVFLYPRERIVLRNNVVVEVEQFAGEAPATVAPPAVSGSPNEPAPSGARPSPPATQAPSPSDSKVEIKSVRPPSKDGRPSAIEPARVAPAPAIPPPGRVAPTTSPAITTPPPTSDASVAKRAQESPEQEQQSVPARAERVAEKKAIDEPAAKTKNVESPAAVPRRKEATTPPMESVVGVRTYLLAFIVVAGGAGLLFWRYRQRQLELAASTVENTPVVTATTPAFAGNTFTADVLGALEWKRFEELVAAYYNKTGVVAVRTKTGPDRPVHIKISWKGEPRPFAYVMCIPQPAGAIDPKPLQKLVAALATEDIRRGYIVTAGRFNAAAREFADEKHLTLLPGDTFLDKLNALPATARTEIMQVISVGDYTVPSCPKCNARMVQPAENPAVWRCPDHPDQVIPAHK